MGFKQKGAKIGLEESMEEKRLAQTQCVCVCALERGEEGMDDWSTESWDVDVT